MCVCFGFLGFIVYKTPLWNRLAHFGLAGFRRFNLALDPDDPKWIIGIDVVFQILYIFKCHFSLATKQTLAKT